MEVQRLNRLFTVVAMVFVLGACAEKTVKSVFPEAQNQPQGLCGDSMLPTQFLVRWEDGSITLENDQNAERFTQRFITPHLSRIQSVEFNKRIQLPTPPTDSETEVATFASTAWNWGQDSIEASAAWTQGVQGQGVKVGVTDTAIDLNHVQLSGQIAVNLSELNGRSGVDDDANGLIDDVKGWDFLHNRPHGIPAESDPQKVDSHGSHVAGIIAAEHGKGPIQGVAPRAQIVPASFLSESGEGNLYGAIMSLEYAASQGASVINASWGGPNCSQALKDTLKSLSDRDVVLVVAAGNDGQDLESYPDFPAAFEIPSQLTVAALRSSGYLAAFSNTSYRYVHLAAPGDGIYSTVPFNQVMSMSGTSMAAPFVSGAAALLRSFRPQASALQVKQALMESVDSGNYRVATRGRLNVRKALERLQVLTAPATP